MPTTLSDPRNNTILTSKIRLFVFPLVAVLSFVFLIWRAKFGYCFMDEPFIISLAQRMYMGDALIVDEWHVCQNTGPLLLPFYALFRLFSADNESLMLCFRYIYCVFWWLSCVYVYKKLSNESTGFIGPIAVFIYLVLFSPLDYMVLSYTCLGLAACLFLCCFLYRVPDTRQPLSPGAVLFFSALWVVLTLCCPYVAPLFVLFLIFFILAGYIEKKKGVSHYFRNVRAVSLASLPVIAVICVVYLFAFIFSRAELSQVLPNLANVLNDPQHESRNFFKCIISTPGYVFLYAPGYVSVCFIVFIIALFKKFRPYRLILFSVCAFAYITTQLAYTKTVFPAFIPDVPLLNQQMLYIGLLGAVAFALLDNRPYKLFFIFQGIGWCYTVAQNFASNSRIYTISMSLSVIGVCGILCLAALAKEFRLQYSDRKVLRRFSVLLVAAVLTVQLGSELCVRFIRTTLDEPLSSLTQEIKYGSAKGIVSTPEKAEYHDLIYENLQYLLSGVDTEGKRFLCTSGTPHVYLDVDLDYGVYSSWNCFLEPEQLTARIEAYQALHPDSLPDIIFSASESDILPITDNSFRCMEYRGSYLFVRN